MRRRVIACAVLVLSVMIGGAQTASAHTKLVEVVPSGTVERVPATVTVRFSRDIGDALSDVTLTAPDGSVTEVIPEIDGPVATLRPPKLDANGTWTVGWTIVGADGHPVVDSRRFILQVPVPKVVPTPDVKPTKEPAASADTSSDAAHAPAAHVQPAESFPSKRWERIGLAGRIAFYVGLLGFVGGGMFALFAAKGFWPWMWGGAGLLTAFGAGLVLLSHAALLGRLGGFDLLGPTAWFDAITSIGGRGVAASTAAVALAWWIGREALSPPAWRRRDGAQPWLVLILLLIAVASPASSGHAVASESAWRVPLDVVHLACGAAWVGGLVQVLGLAVASRASHPRLPGAIAGYSRIAFVSVVGVVLTGVAATWIELDAELDDLFTSTWGRLVLAKILLLGIAAPLARMNHRRNVPALAGGGERARLQLRKLVRGEIAVAVLIIVATAVLVSESPPAHEEHSMMHDDTGSATS